MQVAAMIDTMGLEVLNLAEGAREVTNGYAGDLLSWVMGRAESDMVWVTIMTNVNILAVASLRDLSAVLIAEGAEIGARGGEKGSRTGNYPAAQSKAGLCALCGAGTAAGI